MMLFAQLGTAFLLSAFIVALAFWRGSLSSTGAIGALLVGTLIFGLGGWIWGVLLGLFFVSSSLLSHYKEEQKKAAAEKFDKGHRRDLAQVMANGGIGALLALLAYLLPHPGWFAAFIGVMGTVTADTWATELGTLSSQPPRLITTGGRVEVGTSGGVTLFGTAVSLFGGMLVGLTAGLLSEMSIALALWLGGVGGLAGSLFDSLLGATVQAVYYSKIKQKETEKKLDVDGRPNPRVRGASWMSNDVVNLLASLFGGLVSFLLFCN